MEWIGVPPLEQECYAQEDHSVWLESLLFHTLPAPVGAFLEQHAKPLIGAHKYCPCCCTTMAS